MSYLVLVRVISYWALYCLLYWSKCSIFLFKFSICASDLHHGISRTSFHGTGSSSRDIHDYFRLDYGILCFMPSVISNYCINFWKLLSLYYCCSKVLINILFLHFPDSGTILWFQSPSGYQLIAMYLFSSSWFCFVIPFFRFLGKFF